MEGEGAWWVSYLSRLEAGEKQRMNIEDAEKLTHVLNRHFNNDNSVANAIQIRELCRDLNTTFPYLNFYVISDSNLTIKVQ